MKQLANPKIVTFEKLTKHQLAQLVPRKAMSSRFKFKAWCLDHFTATQVDCSGKDMASLRTKFPYGASFGEILQSFGKD